MHDADELMKRALKTQDPGELFKLFEQSIGLVKFTQAQLAFSKKREQQLSDQVKRQTAIIDNLEKTLWNKKGA